MGKFLSLSVDGFISHSHQPMSCSWAASTTDAYGSGRSNSSLPQWAAKKPATREWSNCSASINCESL